MSIILRMQNVQFIHKRGQLLCSREAAADCIIETKSSHGSGFWVLWSLQDRAAFSRGVVRALSRTLEIT
jgi:hypothetical protein